MPKVWFAGWGFICISSWKETALLHSPSLSLAACWAEEPSGKLCYGKLHNLKSSFSILVYNKHYCSLCTCTAAIQIERALLLKIVSYWFSLRSNCQQNWVLQKSSPILSNREKVLRKHKECVRKIKMITCWSVLYLSVSHCQWVCSHAEFQWSYSVEYQLPVNRISAVFDPTRSKVPIHLENSLFKWEYSSQDRISVTIIPILKLILPKTIFAIA